MIKPEKNIVKVKVKDNVLTLTINAEYTFNVIRNLLDTRSVDCSISAVNDYELIVIPLKGLTPKDVLKHLDRQTDYEYTFKGINNITLQRVKNKLNQTNSLLWLLWGSSLITTAALLTDSELFIILCLFFNLIVAIGGAVTALILLVEAIG